MMTPETLFQIANPAALLGWGALVLSPLAPRLADILAGIVIPLALSVGYAGLVLAFWATAPGGFGSLPDVMALFTSAPVALAGWLHYLAFDLFVGAWVARTARSEDIPHLFALPCLALTFLFGPAGYLCFSILRLTRSRMKGFA
jgi:hypothetical protein